MAKSNLLSRVRRICAALPDTEESSRLGGEPHFYVGGKIYTGCGLEGDSWQVGMKVGRELQSLLITRPGFHVAKYVGRYGWISVDESALADDAELERLIRMSYGLIAGEGACGPVAKKRAKKAKAQPKKASPKAKTASPKGKQPRR